MRACTSSKPPAFPGASLRPRGWDSGPRPRCCRPASRELSFPPPGVKSFCSVNTRASALPSGPGDGRCRARSTRTVLPSRRAGPAARGSAPPARRASPQEGAGGPSASPGPQGLQDANSAASEPGLLRSSAVGAEQSWGPPAPEAQSGASTHSGSAHVGVGSHPFTGSWCLPGKLKTCLRRTSFPLEVWM